MNKEAVPMVEPNPPIEYSIHHEALVFIIRSKRGNVLERSIQRFKTEDDMNIFWRAAQQYLPSVEIHKIKIRHPEDREIHEKVPGKLWCPYCETHRKFIRYEDYTRCEICTISTADFYVIRHNRITEKNDPAQEKTPEQIAKAEKRRKRKERKKGNS
jgi:hypothetical protein